MAEQQNPHDDIQDVNKLIAERKHKLAALRAGGFMFPNDFRRDSISSDLIAKYDHLTKEQLEAGNITVSLGGRIITRRIMGKASLTTIADMGGKIQL